MSVDIRQTQIIKARGLPLAPSALMRKTPPPPPVEVLTQLSFEDFKNGVISICGNPHDYPQNVGLGLRQHIEILPAPVRIERLS
jgi:hypothetical protein